MTDEELTIEELRKKSEVNNIFINVLRNLKDLTQNENMIFTETERSIIGKILENGRIRLKENIIGKDNVLKYEREKTIEEIIEN
tara:strand:- start:29724 stop:29975 length:252 start_codon:yes stop_codon:yes gene_type:complete